MYSFSTEQLGTTAFAYLTPIGPAGERSTGKGLDDFDLRFLNPLLEDITGSTDITMVEFQSNESDPSTGSYCFSVPLPSTGEGNYSLRVTDEWGQLHYCAFNAYLFPPKTDTGDSTAQVEIEAYESNGDPVGTLTLGELTLYLFNPSYEEVSEESGVGLTLSKIEDGRFLLEWDASSEEGEWFVDVISSDYFSGGQQGVWRYQEQEDYASPAIDDLDVSADGLTVELALIAGDAPYIVSQLRAADGTLRDEDLRLGSGSVTLTREVNESGGVVVFGADEDGYPYGDPTFRIILAGTETSGDAADDNVPVAIRAMKQTAVYWSLLNIDDSGRPTWGEPVVIACRWDKVREEFTDSKGDRELSRARLIVDRDLTIKGMLMLGTLDNVVDLDDPRNNDGAWEIRHFRKTANFKGTKYLREVYL